MSAPDAALRWHLLVRGRVQGVGFRWFLRQTAEQMGLTGWARNNPDGTVEVEVQGTSGSLKEFLGSVRTGHPYARVDAVERQDGVALGNETRFETR